jgi:hypothetical protein
MKNRPEPFTEERRQMMLGEVVNAECDGFVPESLLYAIELSLAKWHPSRGYSVGYGNCGLCMFFDDSLDDKDDCSKCPISLGSSEGCFNDEHPYSIFNEKYYEETGFMKSAEAVYNLIYDAWEIEKSK